MSILYFFKKKKKTEKKPEKKPEKKIEKKAKKKPEKKPEKKTTVRPLAKKKSVSTAYKVLLSPHVTEKATGLGEKNKYVFNVWPNSNKIEIKKGVESLYGVSVVGVNIINIHRKKIRVGRKEGWKKGYKKAIVEIKKGQKIEIMPR